MARTRRGQGAARPGLVISDVPPAPSNAVAAPERGAAVAAEAVDPRLCRLEVFEAVDLEGRPVQSRRYVPLTQAELDERAAREAAELAREAAEQQDRQTGEALRAPLRAVIGKLRTARQAGTLGTVAALTQPELELAAFALLRADRGAM